MDLLVEPASFSIVTRELDGSVALVGFLVLVVKKELAEAM
jgi:hypothetical protein